MAPRGDLWVLSFTFPTSSLRDQTIFSSAHGVPRVDALLVNGVIFAITHALQWKEVLREYPVDGS